MGVSGPTIFLVDDDVHVLDGLSRLLRSSGWNVHACASAEDFMQQCPDATPGCVLLDICMPGMSGVGLHDWLNARGSPLSVIYLTGHSTVPVSVGAMKRGAYDFLEKPVDEDLLFPALKEATERSIAKHAMALRSADVEHRLDRLTQREREVMTHVISGRLNKQIAGDLGIALKTVKVHRSRVMEKMSVRSVAQLVALCDDVGVRG